MKHQSHVPPTPFRRFEKMPPPVDVQMHPPADFILWFVCFLIAQFPLRVHNSFSVMGAGPRLMCDLSGFTPLGIQLLDKLGVSAADYFRRVLIEIALENLGQQINLFIGRVLRNSDQDKLYMLKTFILVAITQRDLLHRMTPAVTRNQMLAKVRVCDTIIRVCTNKLNLLLPQVPHNIALSIKSAIALHWAKLDQSAYDRIQSEGLGQWNLLREWLPQTLEVTSECIIVPGQS